MPLSHWIGNAESEMVFQQITHGHVDYGEAVLSGVLEPIAGPISGKIAGPGTQTLLTRGIEAGTTQGYVMGNYHWTASPGPHNAETYVEHVARKGGRLRIPDTTSRTPPNPTRPSTRPNEATRPTTSPNTRYHNSRHSTNGAAGVQPVKAIEDSDTLGQLPGGGNQILIIDEQVKNQWKTKK